MPFVQVGSDDLATEAPVLASHVDRGLPCPILRQSPAALLAAIQDARRVRCVEILRRGATRSLE
jgi:hypothetical protein